MCKHLGKQGARVVLGREETPIFYACVAFQFPNSLKEHIQYNKLGNQNCSYRM